MNVLAWKRFSFAALAICLLGLGLALNGCQTATTPTSGQPETTRPAEGPEALRAKGTSEPLVIVPIEEYIEGRDPNVRLSVRTQQSVLWRCERCKFKILSVKADSRHKGNPPDLPKRFPRGPFYREFPDRRDLVLKDELFSEVASGPVQPLAAPASEEEYYMFKATIRVRDSRGTRDIDPHIMTRGGAGH
jgi:hypothetical protein